jgi:hypothetical protein
LKHGNIALAKKHCHLVGVSQEGSHRITAKYHAARAPERYHGHTIRYLQAITAEERRIGQKRLAAQGCVRTARH